MKEKLKELNIEISNLSVQRDTLKAKWRNEKEIVEFLQKSAITPISISRADTKKDDFLSFLNFYL